ncbi:MAG: hypothetical protein IKO47_09380 [Ruminococcus sp.]|nr:hypothetical protein [Ruminococcus sp.]
MKKTIFIAVTAAALLLTGCGSTSLSSDDSVADYYATMIVDDTSAYASATMPDTSSDDIDIDLTQLDSNMIYAQVYDMVYNGDKYLGKKVKVKGPFSYFKEDDGREFFAVLVSDATACCSQGIEFVLAEDHKYPEDYPEIGTKITVIGKFNYYKEDSYTYCQLIDADMEVDDSLSW